VRVSEKRFFRTQDIVIFTSRILLNAIDEGSSYGGYGMNLEQNQWFSRRLSKDKC